jgi:hypothetical protein
MTVPKELIFIDADGTPHDVSNSVFIRDWIKFDEMRDRMNIDRLLDWRNRLTEMRNERNDWCNEAYYNYEINATDFLLSLYASELK